MNRHIFYFVPLWWVAGHLTKRVCSIVYNRVPKCGSSGFLYVINQLSEKNHFKWVGSQDFHHPVLTETEQVSSEGDGCISCNYEVTSIVQCLCPMHSLNIISLNFLTSWMLELKIYIVHNAFKVTWFQNLKFSLPVSEQVSHYQVSNAFGHKFLTLMSSLPENILSYSQFTMEASLIWQTCPLCQFHPVSVQNQSMSLLTSVVSMDFNYILADFDKLSLYTSTSYEILWIAWCPLSTSSDSKKVTPGRWMRRDGIWCLQFSIISLGNIVNVTCLNTHLLALVWYASTSCLQYDLYF